MVKMVEQCFLDITVQYGNLNGASERLSPPHHRVVSGGLQLNTRIALALSQFHIHTFSLPISIT